MEPGNNRKVAFPQIAHYNGAIKYFIEVGLGAEYVMPPKMTRRTMETGTKLSPDYVCTPFKSTLGSMIDALEAGANVLMMSMGLCRLGYYGELQEQILRDMGYEFEMINFAEYTTGKNRDYLKVLRKISPKISWPKASLAIAESLRMVAHIDEIEAEYYKNCGFEIHKGEYKKALDRFYLAMDLAASRKDVEEGYKTAKREFHEIEIDKPEQPVKVGIIGEFFTIMDEFSNLDLEQKLADMGVEVHRMMNISNRTFRYEGQKNLGVKISEYCQYEMGPTSTLNIWSAKNYAEQGFDGIIHVKSAGCTPEIDTMPILQNISADYKIPILYLTYDSQTSDTGLATRVEAFYDMISMRKQVEI